MPGVRSIALISVRTTILPKKIELSLRVPFFVTFLSFILGNKLLDQNVVEFDFSIGHALVIFSIFINNKQKNIMRTRYNMKY